MSADGTDVATSKKWVTQTVKDTLSTVITEAKAVDDNASATQAEVDAVKIALDAAVTAFNEARQDGTSVRSTLEEAITAAEGVNSAVTGAPNGTGVSNAATWVPSTVKDDFTAAITTAKGVKENDLATDVQLNDALADLAAAKSTFDTAQKHGYDPVEGGKLKVTPIYRGFQVELTSSLGSDPFMLLCNGIPLFLFENNNSPNVKYIFQGPNFESGSYVFTPAAFYDDNYKGTPVTAYATDVVGSDAANLYHTNIDMVNFDFYAGSSIWQLRRDEVPVRNTALVPNEKLQYTETRIHFSRYTSGTYRAESTMWFLVWENNAIDIWTWLYGGERAFGYQVTYYCGNDGAYAVYAGNTGLESYPAPQTITAQGSINLQIEGNNLDYRMSRLGLFTDPSLNQAIGFSDWVVYHGSSNTWDLPVLSSNIVPGATVYFGVVLYGRDGQKKTMAVPDGNRTIPNNISGGLINVGDLGTVPGNYDTLP
ncbi:MAG: hypothetical protein LBK83_07570 [Treponema sp.]|nr:hypothetical protein [Treponema sp.]